MSMEHFQRKYDRRRSTGHAWSWNYIWYPYEGINTVQYPCYAVNVGESFTLPTPRHDFERGALIIPNSSQIDDFTPLVKRVRDSVWDKFRYPPRPVRHLKVRTKYIGPPGHICTNWFFGDRFYIDYRLGMPVFDFGGFNVLNLLDEADPTGNDFASFVGDTLHEFESEIPPENQLGLELILGIKDLLPSLGEIRDLVSAIKARRIQLSRLAKSDRLPKGVDSAYLQWSFVYAPLKEDFAKLLGLINNVDQAFERLRQTYLQKTPVRKSRVVKALYPYEHFENPYGVPVRSPAYELGYPNRLYLQKSCVVKETWAVSGNLFHNIDVTVANTFLGNIQALLGNPVVGAWELFPGSFLIDYVFNVSDLLRDLFDFQPMLGNKQLLDFSCSIKRSATFTMDVLEVGWDPMDLSRERLVPIWELEVSDYGRSEIIPARWYTGTLINRGLNSLTPDRVAMLMALGSVNSYRSVK